MILQLRDLHYCMINLKLRVCSYIRSVKTSLAFLILDIFSNEKLWRFDSLGVMTIIIILDLKRLDSRDSYARHSPNHGSQSRVGTRHRTFIKLRISSPWWSTPPFTRILNPRWGMFSTSSPVLADTVNDEKTYLFDNLFQNSQCTFKGYIMDHRFVTTWTTTHDIRPLCMRKKEKKNHVDIIRCFLLVIHSMSTRPLNICMMPFNLDSREFGTPFVQR